MSQRAIGRARILLTFLTMTALAGCSSILGIEEGVLLRDADPTNGSDPHATVPIMDDAGDDADKADSGTDNGAPDKCAIPPGTYTMTFTARPGGKDSGGRPCEQHLVGELEIKEKMPELAEGCSLEMDEATCTHTVKCKTTGGGLTTTSETVTSYKDGKVTGSLTTKIVDDADGGVVGDCSYDFEGTKK